MYSLRNRTAPQGAALPCTGQSADNNAPGDGTTNIAELDATNSACYFSLGQYTPPSTPEFAARPLPYTAALLRSSAALGAQVAALLDPEHHRHHHQTRRRIVPTLRPHRQRRLGPRRQGRCRHARKGPHRPPPLHRSRATGGGDARPHDQRHLPQRGRLLGQRP